MVSLKAPSTLPPGSQVRLIDGSTVVVDADSLISVAAANTAYLLNAGFELTTSSVGGTSDATASTVAERDSNADASFRDTPLSLTGGVNVINKTGVSIAAGKLVALVGLDATSGKPKIVLADADVAAYDDVYVTIAAIADQAAGRVYKGALSAADINTNSASSAGDPVYLSTTAGAFAHTAPSGLTARVQPVGFVVVKSATVGQILWLVSPVRVLGSNELQTKITCGEIALDGSNPTPVAHGLTTVTSFYAGIKKTSSPGVGTSVLTFNINGANVDVYAWKVTGTGDTTLIASTGTETIYWIAVGV